MRVGRAWAALLLAAWVMGCSQVAPTAPPPTALPPNASPPTAATLPTVTPAPPPTGTPWSGPPSAWTYTHPDYGFALAVPAGWLTTTVALTDVPAWGEVVWQAARLADNDPAAPPAALLTLITLPAQGLTLAQAAAALPPPWTTVADYTPAGTPRLLLRAAEVDANGPQPRAALYLAHTDAFVLVHVALQPPVTAALTAEVDALLAALTPDSIRFLTPVATLAVEE